MSNKALWMTAIFWLVAITILAWIVHVAYGAVPGQVKTCSVTLPAGVVADGSCGLAKGVSLCGPAKATDSTYTKDAKGFIQWQPFSTLTASSPVLNCATGAWSTLGAVGAKLPDAPIPPSNTHDYTVYFGGTVTGIQVSHSADGGKTWDTPVIPAPAATSVVFKALPPAGQCFKVVYVTASGNSDPTISCIGSQAITVQ